MCLLIQLFLLLLVLAIQEQVKFKVVIRHLLLIYGRNLCQRALSFMELNAEKIIEIKKIKVQTRNIIEGLRSWLPDIPFELITCRDDACFRIRRCMHRLYMAFSNRLIGNQRLCPKTDK
jgi:hypothetical protein